jgi:hypothetical protein
MAARTSDPVTIPVTAGLAAINVTAETGRTLARDESRIGEFLRSGSNAPKLLASAWM